ncbi:phosphate/phosphite/phosphonate ABC transporter substrate-binding protein [Algisphaera agarilytica]|uniref:Phosphonate transport system substrate-binding protein n=1 Tax=Algisphaera agarilytica TaxID=1385975 RepID=A0A7X0H5M5_9BACT|nr:phosphate/phosphite/phosphonate ABC transporter substrate-binding protein [Algisphaera agarilytica]MBB6429695.1 phosphonate transport system substrate-binding protein [Algisphaera agarilytica]
MSETPSAPETASAESSSAATPPAKRLFSPALVLACVAVGAVVFAIAWSQINSPAVAGRGVDFDRTLNSLGLGSPVSNKLGDAFTDSDQDLVVDTPSDAAALRDPDTLKFCFLSENAGNVDPAMWQPLMDAISQATGKPVEYASFATADDQMLALRDGGLDITLFNTGNVPRAVNAAGFVPVASPSVQSEPASYNMLILTKADSDIKAVEDLRGHRLALTRYGSNSGYKAPLVLLKELGLEPERDYDFAFSGSHDNSIKGLADGSVKADAVAVASDLFAAAIERGEVKEDAFTVVYESEAFPRAAFGMAHSLKPELAQSIQDTVLSFQFAGTSLQAQFPDSDGFSPLAYKDSFALIRRIDDAVGFKHEIKTEVPTAQ